MSTSFQVRRQKPFTGGIGTIRKESKIGRPARIESHARRPAAGNKR